jgi:hypothetical protein
MLVVAYARRTVSRIALRASAGDAAGPIQRSRPIKELGSYHMAPIERPFVENVGEQF